MNCKNCNERMEGDGYTLAYHCPTVELEGVGIEPDADPVYCTPDAAKMFPGIESTNSRDNHPWEVNVKKKMMHKVQDGVIWFTAICAMFGSAAALLFALVPLMIDIGTRAAYGVAAYFGSVGIGMAGLGLWLLAMLLRDGE